MNQPQRKIVFSGKIAIELSSCSFKAQRPFGELTSTTRLFNVSAEAGLGSIIPKKRQRTDLQKELVVEQVQLPNFQPDTTLQKKLQDLEDQILSINAAFEPERGSRIMPYKDDEAEEAYMSETAPPDQPVSEPTPPLYSEVERETVKQMLEEINRACHLTAEQISIIRRYGYNIARDPWGFQGAQGTQRRVVGRSFRPRFNGNVGRRPFSRPEPQVFDFSTPNSASFLAVQSAPPQPPVSTEVRVKEEPSEAYEETKQPDDKRLETSQARQPEVHQQSASKSEAPEEFNTPYILVPQRVLVSMRPLRTN